VSKTPLQPAPLGRSSGGGVVADQTANPLLVLGAILLKQVVRLCLGRRLGVRVVKEVLDAQQDLLDGDGGLPCLLLVENRQANGA
jgi:hypothetical protein